jgi:putative FmdB family regulatory protein
MPLYEFECNKCSQKTEQLCKMGESGQELVCPHCSTKGLRRLVSGFAAPGVKGGQDKCSSCKGGSCSTC